MAWLPADALLHLLSISGRRLSWLVRLTTQQAVEFGQFQTLIEALGESYMIALGTKSPRLQNWIQILGPFRVDDSG